MKVISLHQPWASLFVAGAKLIETRSWGTKHRGMLAVHAAKTVDVQACSRQPFAEALTKLGFNHALELPLGAVLGTVTLVDCLLMRTTEQMQWESLNEYGAINIEDDRRLTEDEREFGAYQPGRFAWVTLPAPRFILAEPIPLRGFQKVWNLPDEIARRLAP